LGSSLAGRRTRLLARLIAFVGVTFRRQPVNFGPEIGLQVVQVGPKLRQALLLEASRPAGEVKTQKAIGSVLAQDEFRKGPADVVDRASIR